MSLIRMAQWMKGQQPDGSAEAERDPCGDDTPNLEPHYDEAGNFIGNYDPDKDEFFPA